MRKPKHTEIRYKTFYAVLGIPKDVRHKLGGKLRFMQSLKTDSFAEAEKRVVPVVQNWRSLIETARSGGSVSNKAGQMAFDLERLRLSGVPDWEIEMAHSA